MGDDVMRRRELGFLHGDGAYVFVLLCLFQRRLKSNLICLSLETSDRVR